MYLRIVRISGASRDVNRIDANQRRDPNSRPPPVELRSRASIFDAGQNRLLNRRYAYSQVSIAGCVGTHRGDAISSGKQRSPARALPHRKLNLGGRHDPDVDLTRDAFRAGVRSRAVGISLAAAFDAALSNSADAQTSMQFPQSTATPSEACAGCHQVIYKEFAEAPAATCAGPGCRTIRHRSRNRADRWRRQRRASRHHGACRRWNRPVAARCQQGRRTGKRCNVCHYPRRSSTQTPRRPR